MTLRRLNTIATLLLLALAALAPAALAQDAAKQALNEQMWEAARKGDAAAVKAALDKGADVNAKFRYGTTALFKAAERGHVEVVKLLIERGVDVSVRDTFYQATAMTWALSNKHVEVVKALLEKDGSNVADVLMTGVREGNPTLVRAALDKGGMKPETLTAALASSAADEKKAEIADMLRKAGAQPPPEVDAATLASYGGKYRSETGTEITISTKDGKLFATPAGQGPFAMMAVDKATFRPTEFDGLQITFNAEAGKVTDFALKQGANTRQFKKVDGSQ